MVPSCAFDVWAAAFEHWTPLAYSFLFLDASIGLSSLLERIGINVQDKLSHTTNFCIVGAQLFSDPETNEPLEDPVDPTDLPEYRDAVAQNVIVVSLADIEEFLRGAGGVGN